MLIGRVLWLCVKSGAIKSPLNFWSANSPSSVWCVKLLRTSRQICASRALPSVLCRWAPQGSRAGCGGRWECPSRGPPEPRPAPPLASLFPGLVWALSDWWDSRGGRGPRRWGRMRTWALPCPGGTWECLWVPQDNLTEPNSVVLWVVLWVWLLFFKIAPQFVRTVLKMLKKNTFPPPLSSAVGEGTLCKAGSEVS